MKTTDLLTIMRKMDTTHRRWYYSIHELNTLFPTDERQQLKNALTRQVKAENLIRVGSALYVYPYATSIPAYRLEHLIGPLRPRELSYISLESALSLYGLISQIPLSTLTVMTTGRSYKQDTPWGCIEWIHTERDEAAILKDTHWDPSRGCLIASASLAQRDLHRVGRNTDLVINDKE